MLICFAGLPGAGKSTLARACARAFGATYLRIDTIDHALRTAGLDEVWAEGYVAAYALATENLRLGRPVVADSVNPLRLTRDAWRNAAAAAGVPIIEIEIICSDPSEHRQRLETRENDIPGSAPVSWQKVLDRSFEPWDRPHLVIDTAGRSAEAAFDELQARIGALGSV